MKFKDILSYMTLSREERRSHLKLKTKCVFIGGNSLKFQGLLGYFLKTTIPNHKSIMCCHACNNRQCSNVKHLYWGNYRDNMLDYLLAGGSSYASRVERKYGKAVTAKIRKNAGSLGGKANRKRAGDANG